MNSLKMCVCWGVYMFQWLLYLLNYPLEMQYCDNRILLKYIFIFKYWKIRNTIQQYKMNKYFFQDYIYFSFYTLIHFIKKQYIILNKYSITQFIITDCIIES